MSEYISRSGALQFVFDACTECMDTCAEFDGIMPDCHQCSLEGVKLKLRDMPAADVRPVILCKDCKKWHRGSLPVAGMHGCDERGDYTNPDDFCAWAEKLEAT